MKRITTFLIAFICCVALYAQKDIVYKPVLLSIDKADGQYAAGETVNVYGQLMEDIGETEFVCYVESNGSMVGEKRMVQLKQGEKALVYSASAVIISHNHPSGSAKPSTADVKQTEALHKALKYMEINLLDHIIIAEDSFTL